MGHTGSHFPDQGLDPHPRSPRWERGVPTTGLPGKSLFLFSYLYIYFWPHCTACGILVSWPRIEPVIPALGVWSLNHWTTREVPRSHLFICAFISFALGNRSPKKYHYDLCQSVLPMFSSRSFMVSGLTFRSLIHFEFIFVYGVTRECLLYS